MGNALIGNLKLLFSGKTDLFPVKSLQKEQVNQWTPFKVQLQHVDELFMLRLKTFS